MHHLWWLLVVWIGLHYIDLWRYLLLLLNILENLFLRSLIKGIQKWVLVDKILLILVIHHISSWIWVLVNKLRFLNYLLLHRHLLMEANVLFRLGLVIVFYLIRLLCLIHMRIITMRFSVSTIVTVIVLIWIFLRNLWRSSIVLSWFLTALAQLRWEGHILWRFKWIFINIHLIFLRSAWERLITRYLISNFFIEIKVCHWIHLILASLNVLRSEYILLLIAIYWLRTL